MAKNNRKGKSRSYRPKAPTDKHEEHRRLKHQDLIAEREENKKLEEVINTDQSNRVVAFIRNLDYDIAAHGVVQCLEPLSGVPGSIRKCEIIPKNNNNGNNRRSQYKQSSGMARVFFSSKLAFNNLLAINNSSGIVIGKRRIIFGPDSRGQSTSAPCYENFHTRTYNMTRLSVGQLNQKQSTFQAYYSSDQNVSIELNDQSHSRKMTIFFDQYKLVFSIKNMYHLNCITPTHNSADSIGLLYFQVSSPPLVYCTEDKLIDDAIGGSSNDTSVYGFSLASLLKGFRSSLLWDITVTDKGKVDDREWVRYVDPSECNAFGIGYHYCLQFNKSDIDTNIFDTMHRFSINYEKLINRFAVDLAFEASSLDWCGGYAQYLTGLPFPVRYALHALATVGKLALCSQEDADALLVRIGLCTDAVDVLHNFFFAPSNDSSLDAPLEWLDWYIAEEQVQTGAEGTVYESSERDADALAAQLGSISLDDRKAVGNAKADRVFVDDGEDDDDDDEEGKYLMMRRVVVTPLRVCPQPPVRDFSNRIIRSFRQYKDRFIRVGFADENFSSITQPGFGEIIERRVREAVENGIDVGGEHFSFLAYSNSQLRDQSCWFYNERHDEHVDGVRPPNAEEVRQSMGDLSSIRSPGRHGARLGQGFSTSMLQVRTPYSLLHLA